MDGQELKQADDPEARLREAAIDLFIGGQKPTVICRVLNRSRTWFYDTLTRYQKGGRPALTSQSRAPAGSQPHTRGCRGRDCPLAEGHRVE